jgi:cyclopropane fatty-acyl-phospholipid synthase-like methyltransferase
MTTQPTSADVAAMYDQLTELFTNVLGGCIHVGYWDSDDDASSMEAASARTTDLVAERLELAPGQRVLDIGCGNGAPAARIATRNHVQVTGVTVSQHQLQLAQDRAEHGESAGQVSFQFADAMDLPFDAASFDGAYAIESLVHMRDKDAALGHIARVLRPGGRFVVADLCLDETVDDQGAETVEQVRGLFPMATILSADDYRETLERAGLEIVEFIDIWHNIRRTFPIFLEGLRQAAESAGGEVGDQLAATASVLARFVDLPQLGYVLLSAIRVGP